MEFSVVDVQVHGGYILHVGNLEGTLKVGDTVKCFIDQVGHDTNLSLLKDCPLIRFVIVLWCLNFRRILDETLFWVISYHHDTTKMWQLLLLFIHRRSLQTKSSVDHIRTAWLMFMKELHLPCCNLFAIPGRLIFIYEDLEQNQGRIFWISFQISLTYMRGLAILSERDLKGCLSGVTTSLQGVSSFLSLLHNCCGGAVASIALLLI